MSGTSGRNILASIVGWLIVIFAVWFLFGGIFGAIRFIVRMLVFLVIWERR